MTRTISRRKVLRIGGGTAATLGLSAMAGELASVGYANGASLTAIGKDDAGRVTSLTWRTSDGRQIPSTVARTRALWYPCGYANDRAGAPSSRLRSARARWCAYAWSSERRGPSPTIRAAV